MEHGIIKAECPPFDSGDNVEAILRWADASVEWSDVFVNGKGERKQRPNLAHWSEEMCHHEKYLGKRVHRGLFKSSTGVILNALLA